MAVTTAIAIKISFGLVTAILSNYWPRLPRRRRRVELHLLTIACRTGACCSSIHSAMRGCDVRSGATIPGALSILKGTVPAGSVDLDIWSHLLS